MAPTLTSTAPYREHRAQFQEVLAELSAAAVIPTSQPVHRNADCEHRFRPGSDFWYLTGFDEPGAVLVLLPPSSKREQAESVLFLNPKDPAVETWTGRRLGVEAAPAALGVDRAFPIDSLWDELPDLLEGAHGVVWRAGLDADLDRDFNAALETLRGRARTPSVKPTVVLDPGPLLHELRLFKSPAELECMRRAVAVTAEAHGAVMAQAAAGVGERELDATLDHLFRARGGTGSAYVNIVAGGDNACVLHYVKNDCALVDGELVLVDAGCEWDYYASDVTRTFPVNGRFSEDQRALYEVVLRANVEAVEHAVDGATIAAVHERAIAVLVEGLIELGLLEGSVEEALASRGYSRFYPHGTSHWLGIDVHDCGAYVQDGEPRVLEPGMVLTVEPGLYVSADDEGVDARWRGIGIRIEDDVLIVPGGQEVLTRGIPKGIEEVEAACGARAPAGIAGR